MVAPAGILPIPAEVVTGPGFSHVVRYGPRSALGAAMVDSLLDAASHGPADRSGWVLICPGPKG